MKTVLSRTMLLKTQTAPPGAFKTESIRRPPDRLLSNFDGHQADSRVLLAAAILTLESFWGRVTLACYTGLGSGTIDGLLHCWAAEARCGRLSIVGLDLDFN
ncbi:hypothetical protein PoB_004590300 [Plakobranchus ocellatus]|uniref:Uncharacterized protein n=1 Tax=Plakobranchus ocellatus TaxID=259542 RepID=A0AAV4BJQ4_9GAST|nr:hypothetical protein PoB_004590300 [Plakobranchus ocellatus]